MRTQEENRRTIEDHEELRVSLGDAEKALRADDPRSAVEALKRAGVKSAVMWGGIGVPILPRPVRDLGSLAGEVQNLHGHADGQTAQLLERLDEVRSAFDHAAEKETGVLLDGASPAV